ncbi:diguanylate cyclase (GGDEF) domain-containing protein [Roseateles sp. YR242]|uniref:GGDEF domain-containing protein n=1 Tax=Roseateles sp. YR242 TaxID=1855305 RepID=UPI0008D12D36|nr:sensor domain-containing diguanylate cyclase [Roseateles sp. YR242]SEL20184.1 diguanylate cyclase (GGDEF) domain-containing protein [Roseateles sp. YR242]
MELTAAASPAPASFDAWLASFGAPLGPVAAGLVSLLEPTGACLAVKSMATGRYVFASAGLTELFSRTEQGMVGATDNELMRADEVQAMRRAEQATLAQRGVVSSEHRLELGGRRREVMVTRIPLGSEHIMALWSDKTEERHRESHLQRALQQLEQQQKALEQMRRELQQGSGRDEVSGLYMRAQFDDQLLREIDLSTREHREFTLVLIALDAQPAPEGQVLDHEARQRLLEGLGRMLRANTRAMDAACRIGEDLFAVLLSGVGLATAHARMEQLRRQCHAQIVVLHGQDLGLSLSMGVASFPHTASRQEELLHAAEMAVKEAQRRGGNQVVLASIPFGLGG